MASTSRRPAPAANKTILAPVITLKGHEDDVQSISYFPEGKQMIGGSADKTVRRWDLQVGKEIEKAPKVCDYGVRTVAVSGDNRWVVTSGGDRLLGGLTAWEVEQGIVKTFHDHSRMGGSGSATSQFAKLDS
ncbi:hypothetical protein AZE42_08531 [Rhizopogon vesiculosus]|uniref:Uncharacterized protein n=1 Tax=Rhizopogon vesiculosus TaxID=180088 RepID=A0A1J8PQI5_9AGAM|nr:hypothetical protein AZE42_08531 [Rhizopogon vesiculosus]